MKKIMMMLAVMIIAAVAFLILRIAVIHCQNDNSYQSLRITSRAGSLEITNPTMSGFVKNHRYNKDVMILFIFILFLAAIIELEIFIMVPYDSCGKR